MSLVTQLAAETVLMTQMQARQAASLRSMMEAEIARAAKVIHLKFDP